MSFARLPGLFESTASFTFAPGHQLKGKTAIIPCSNGGIGYEAARQLQGLNISNIILAVRSMSKGEAAKNTLAADNTEIAKSDAPRHG